MLEPVEKEIGGSVFIIPPLPATKSLSVLIRILKVVGPAAGKAVGSADSMLDLMDTDLDGLTIGSIVGTLAERLDDAVVIGIVRDLLSGVQMRKDGKYSDVLSVMDTEFAGRLNILFSLVYAAAEVNYGSFFGGGGLLSAVQRWKPSQV